MTNDNDDWLNDAEPQKEFSTIPADIYRLRAKVKPGGVVDPLCMADNGYTEHLKLECTVVHNAKNNAEYAGHKLYEYITLKYTDGGYDPDMPPPLNMKQIDNYETAVAMGRTRLRAIVDSAHELDPKDKSDKAKAIRRPIQDDLLRVSGLSFWAHVNIKEGTNGYKDSNRIDRIITVDADDWPGKKTQDAVVPRDKDLNDDIPY